MDTPKNPHANHRGRLRARFLRSGLSDFAPHNVLELLLFYAIARRDTNPTAHALLDRFRTVDETLGADADALCGVPGIGPATAGFLRGFSAFSEIAVKRRAPRVTYGDAALLGQHFCGLLRERSEAVAVTLLDNDYGVIREYFPKVTDIHSPQFPMTDILAEALLSNAPLCAVAHVHADGLALPLGEDLDITRILRGTLEKGGVHLLEHFIVSGGRYTTLLYRYSGQGPIEKTASDGGIDPTEHAALCDFLALAGIRADADALLATYGDLYRLVTAPVGRHRREGLDERLAALLSLVSAVDVYRVGERCVPSCRDTTALGQYLVSYFRALSHECVLLLLFDGEGRHIATDTVAIGSVGEAAISSRRLAEKALFSGARTAVLAHNHPGGSCAPSDEDNDTTAQIGNALGGLGVEFLGHYIVAGERFLIST